MIWGQSRVALYNGDGLERHVKLIGHDLSQGRLHTCTKIDLPRKDGDHALWIDGEKRVNRVEREWLAGCRFDLCMRFEGYSEQRKADY